MKRSVKLGAYGGVIELGVGFVLGIDVELFLLLGLVAEEVLHHLVALLLASHGFREKKP